MSCDDQSRLLQALNDLRNISKGALQSYRSEYLLVFQKLEALVEDPFIPQGESLQSVEYERSFLTYPDCYGPSPTWLNIIDTYLPFDAQASSTSTIQPDSAAAPKLTNGHETSIPPSISSLVKALDDDSSKIKDFLLRLQFETTGDELESTLEDPRTVDLQFETHRPSLEVKFRKGLSQRSLAMEYTEWENRTYGWSRVSIMAGKLSNSRRNGHIREYLERNTHRFTNQAVIRDGIQHGIKMLVCERLLGRQAISVILCFKSRRFHAVKFEELDSLVTIINQKEWIEELLYQMADWFDNCQRKYNAWYEEILQKRYPSTLVDVSALNTQSAATQVEITASLLTKDNRPENSKHSEISGSGYAISMQRVASSTSFPVVSQQSSTCHVDFMALDPSNRLNVFTTFIPENFLPIN